MLIPRVPIFPASLRATNPIPPLPLIIIMMTITITLMLLQQQQQLMMMMMLAVVVMMIVVVVMFAAAATIFMITLVLQRTRRHFRSWWQTWGGVQHQHQRQHAERRLLQLQAGAVHGQHCRCQHIYRVHVCHAAEPHRLQVPCCAH